MNVRAYNEFLGRLQKQDEAEVMQMRAPVQELVRSPGWKILEQLLGDRIAEMRLMMETGLHEHAEYTAYVGELRGMQTVQSAINAVLEGSSRAAELAVQMAAESEMQ